ncbi:hypothetical protein J437_LFUL002421 [Ladona fulva]|uniref:RBR-type E3 ubiquitin transferase n=1 Tax=Ladona fulva TaxID=123851 RepID=A0A8K0PAF0_LADFU|nr:hypothetical protein J437_LFUL002421 [Ladona fulva]
MTARSSCKSQGPRPPIVEGESYHSSCSSSGIVLGGKGGGGSGNPVDKGGGKRGLARFSLRRLLYSSPLVGRRSGGMSSRGRGEGGMFALGALNSRQQLQQALAAVVGGGGLGGDGHSDSRKRDVEKGSAGTRHTAKEARWGKPSRATRVSSSRKDAKSKNPSGAKSKSVSLVEDTSSVMQVEDEELGSVMVEVSLNNEGLDAREVECPLCLSNYPPEYFPTLGTCMHRSCYDCFQRYLRIEISASRVAVACPQCSEPMHPNDIRMILNDRALYEKYEDFMVRRVLAVDPDTRWCPAPDCGFAVIASGCASCPRLKCERPGCGAHFCYHCRAPWHPDQTCDAARLERSQSPSYLHFHPHHHHSHHHHHGGNNSSAAPSSSSAASSSSGTSSSHGPGPLPNSSSTSSHHRVHSSSSASFGMGDSERGHHSHHHHRDDIKPCPRCQVLIVKMDDGSCNHMTCAVCGAEFCWLCMKLISDLHYLSPSGCTFWGKKPWSRKKKILWQLGTLVGAPVGIGLLAGIAVPAMIIGIPVWVGRKLYARYEQGNRHRRNLAIAGGVTASVS